MIMREFIDNVYLNTRATKIRSNTLQGYLSTIRKHILPYFGDTDIDDIDVPEIEEWLDGFHQSGAAIKAYAVLRMLLNTADDYGFMHVRSPTTRRIRLPKRYPPERKVLTRSEVQLLIDGLRGTVVEAVVILSVYLGLRRGESFAVKWEDIDLESGSVRIHATRQQVKGGTVEYGTKTPLSTRIAYLPNVALRMLREIGDGKTGYVCPLSPSEISRIYRILCLERGLPYVPFTNLRHTWATLAIESGADITMVSRAMGHSDVRMTYDHYVRPREEAFRKMQRDIWR